MGTSRQVSRGAGQMGFEGFGDPVPTDRLFFALFPDAETADDIHALARRLREELGLHGKPLLRERLHVTLHHLGDFTGLPEDMVERATAAAAACRTAPFALRFDHVASFAGKRSRLPCVLRNDDSDSPLHRFQLLLGEALALRGLPSDRGATFTPHVTLLYDDRRVERTEVAPIEWRVSEFRLIHSLLGQTRHIELGRWAL